MGSPYPSVLVLFAFFAWCKSNCILVNFLSIFSMYASIVCVFSYAHVHVFERKKGKRGRERRAASLGTELFGIHWAISSAFSRLLISLLFNCLRFLIFAEWLSSPHQLITDIQLKIKFELSVLAHTLILVLRSFSQVICKFNSVNKAKFHLLKNKMKLRLKNHLHLYPIKPRSC